jgi:hypothetical protein
MPKNNNINPVTLPIETHFGEGPKTEFKNNLEALKIKLVDCTTIEQLKKEIT